MTYNCLSNILLKRNSYLKLPEAFLIVWYELLCKFCQWFINKKISYKSINIENEGMGYYWKQFLENNPSLTDDFGEPEKYLNNTRPDLLNKKLTVDYQKKY